MNGTVTSLQSTQTQPLPLSRSSGHSNPPTHSDTFVPVVTAVSVPLTHDGPAAELGGGTDPAVPVPPPIGGGVPRFTTARYFAAYVCAQALALASSGSANTQNTCVPLAITTRHCRLLLSYVTMTRTAAVADDDAAVLPPGPGATATAVVTGADTTGTVLPVAEAADGVALGATRGRGMVEVVGAIGRGTGIPPGPAADIPPGTAADSGLTGWVLGIGPT